MYLQKIGSNILTHAKMSSAKMSDSLNFKLERLWLTFSNGVDPTWKGEIGISMNDRITPSTKNCFALIIPAWW